MTRRLLGVALAGGRSRRMGHDKTRLRLSSGKDLLQWTVERLAAVCDRVVIAGGERHVEGHRTVADGPGRGPLAGVLGAARDAPRQTLLVLACDLPMVSLEVLRHVSTLPGDFVVPRHGVPTTAASSDREALLEPLCALYSPAAVAALERRAESGRYDLHGLATEPDLGVVFVDEDQLAAFGEPAMLFSNLNHPQDVENLAALQHNI